MDKKLRFLLSGPGLIGRQHARLLKARPDCELVAVVAPPSPENVEFAADYEVPLFGDIGEAIAQRQVDAAVLSPPNVFHFEQASQCLERRIPVLVEKPITDRLDTAKRLMEDSERLGVPVLVGHHRTYSPLLDVAKRFLESPEFGRLVALQGAALFFKPAHYFEEGLWRTKVGGGPILINLIHEIGLMRYLCGEIERLSVLSSNNIRRFEVEDTVAISLEFTNGALGTFLLSDTAASNKSWEMTSGENQAYPYFPTDNCYHFAGTNGSLDFPTMRANWYAADSTPSWWSRQESVQLDCRRADPLERQLAHFVDVVRGDAKPRVSAEDGYRNMLVVEAIYLAASSRSVVEVSDISRMRAHS
jgi:predicted dehydrogenase